jgi:hypothetical protein
VDTIVLRRCAKQFEFVLGEVGFDAVYWVSVSNKPFVVLEGIVTASGEDHDSGHHVAERGR